MTRRRKWAAASSSLRASDIIIKSSSSISLNVGGKGILIDTSGVHLTGAAIDAQADGDPAIDRRGGDGDHQGGMTVA